jgi:hypothetical protein
MLRWLSVLRLRSLGLLMLRLRRFFSASALLLLAFFCECRKGHSKK